MEQLHFLVSPKALKSMTRSLHLLKNVTAAFSSLSQSTKIHDTLIISAVEHGNVTAAFSSLSQSTKIHDALNMCCRTM